MIIERNENLSSSKLPTFANVLTDMPSLVKDAASARLISSRARARPNPFTVISTVRECFGAKVRNPVKRGANAKWLKHLTSSATVRKPMKTHAKTLS
jgi:hypothetical protein